MKYTKPPSKPKQACPHCGAMKVGLADHIRVKHTGVKARLKAAKLATTIQAISQLPKVRKLIEEPLDCPDCGAPMKHITGPFGLFYGCSERRKTGCKGSHGANPDGSPKGIPGDARTRKMRMAAHRVFDPLWKGDEPVFMSQMEAYSWMQGIMGMTKHDGHIGRFGIDECKQLVEHIWAAFGD